MPEPRLLPIANARAAGQRLGLRSVIVLQELPDGRWPAAADGARAAGMDWTKEEEMCVTVIFDGHEIETVGQLRAALGGIVLEREAELREVIAAQGGDLEASCLCGIDLEENAKRFGFCILAEEPDDNAWWIVRIARQDAPDA